MPGSEARRFAFHGPTGEHELVLAWIPGTAGAPYEFGHGPHRRPVELAAWWRYGIEPGAHDGCIGFRVALAPQG